VACDGSQALRLLDGRSFNVILMDIQMPGIDGYETTRLIRAGLGFTALPIIAVTAHEGPGEVAKIKASGMDDYLPKPVDPEKVFKCLAKWVSSPEPSALYQEKAEVMGADDIGKETLDIAAALERMLGNAALYGRLLRDFLAEYGDSGQKLEKLILESDHDAAGRLAHSIKGVSANLGMNGVSSAADVVERAISSGDDISPCLGKLRSALETLRHAIDTLNLEGLEQARPEGPGDTGEARVLIGELRIMLLNGDFNASSLGPGLALAVGEPGGRLVENLVTAMDRFDYTLALGLLEELERNLDL